MVKVKRTFPAPASLEIESKKRTGSYEKPDVIRQLRDDFHNKCYICEMKNLQDPEVEHLLPHKNGKYWDRKFDWNNLFWSCGHCNSVKNQKKYDMGIIDCCKLDPEKVIFFRMTENAVAADAKNENDVSAVVTAELVCEVFNKKNTGLRDCKTEMRFQELTREMNLLYDNLEEIKKHPDSKFVLRKLKALLRRKSAFAAFKREYIREHAERFPQLRQYIE